MQAADPVAFANVPAGHCVHDEAAESEYLPGSHATQVLADVAPVALDEVPAGQLVHAFAPAADHLP